MRITPRSRDRRRDRRRRLRRRGRATTAPPATRRRGDARRRLAERRHRAVPARRARRAGRIDAHDRRRPRDRGGRRGAPAASGAALAPVVVVSLGTNDADGSEAEFRALVDDALAHRRRRAAASSGRRSSGTASRATAFNDVLGEARVDASAASASSTGRRSSSRTRALLADDLVHGTPDGYARRAPRTTARVVRVRAPDDALPDRPRRSSARCCGSPGGFGSRVAEHLPRAAARSSSRTTTRSPIRSSSAPRSTGRSGSSRSRSSGRTGSSGRLMDALGGIPVARARGDVGAVAAAARALDAGDVVAIFPQGTTLGPPDRPWQRGRGPARADDGRAARARRDRRRRRRARAGHVASASGACPRRRSASRSRSSAVAPTIPATRALTARLRADGRGARRDRGAFPAQP